MPHAVLVRQPVLYNNILSQQYCDNPNDLLVFYIPLTGRFIGLYVLLVLIKCCCWHHVLKRHHVQVTVLLQKFTHVLLEDLVNILSWLTIARVLHIAR